MISNKLKGIEPDFRMFRSLIFLEQAGITSARIE
jgi:hypothetical protein